MTTTRRQLIGNISTLIRPGRPFRSDTISARAISVEQLQALLSGLKTWEKPEGYVPTGRRPVTMTHPSEASTDYRRTMSEYISANTGVSIPASSLLSAQLFNAVADYFGL